MTPASGSVEGETTVTVTTSVNLEGYSPDDVQVYVGGEIVIITIRGASPLDMGVCMYV